MRKAAWMHSWLGDEKHAQERSEREAECAARGTGGHAYLGGILSGPLVAEKSANINSLRQDITHMAVQNQQGIRSLQSMIMVLMPPPALGAAFAPALP